MYGSPSFPSLGILSSSNLPRNRFLIEGLVRNVQRSVIVTGDIRAEPDWVDALQRNPLVAKYIRWPRELLMDEASVRRREKGKGKEEDRWPTLDCIYLDTSAVMLDEELMGKVCFVLFFFSAGQGGIYVLQLLNVMDCGDGTEGGRIGTRWVHGGVPSRHQVLYQLLDVGLRGSSLPSFPSF